MSTEVNGVSASVEEAAVTEDMKALILNSASQWADKYALRKAEPDSPTAADMEREWWIKMADNVDHALHAIATRARQEAEDQTTFRVRELKRAHLAHDERCSDCNAAYFAKLTKTYPPTTLTATHEGGADG